MRASPQIVPDTCAPGPAMRRCKRSCRAALHRPCHSDSGQVKLLMLWSLCGRVAAASHNRKCLRTSPERSDARVRFAARAARSAPRRRKPFQTRTRCRRRVGQAPRAACAGGYRRHGHKHPCRARRPTARLLCTGAASFVRLACRQALHTQRAKVASALRSAPALEQIRNPRRFTDSHVHANRPQSQTAAARAPLSGMRRPRQGQTNASTALIPHTALLTYAAHGRIINCGIV